METENSLPTSQQWTKNPMYNHPSHFCKTHSISSSYLRSGSQALLVSSSCFDRPDNTERSSCRVAEQRNMGTQHSWACLPTRWLRYCPPETELLKRAHIVHVVWQIDTTGSTFVKHVSCPGVSVCEVPTSLIYTTILHKTMFYCLTPLHHACRVCVKKILNEFHAIIEKKIQLDPTYYFIMLMLGSTCFGHHYAHHQELATIALVTT